MFSEKVGQAVHEDGLHFVFFNESGQYKYNLELQGVSASHREQPYVKVNKVDLLTDSALQNKSGLCLIVLNDTMQVKSQGVYTPNTTGMNNLVNRIQALTDEVFVIVSMGKYNSNSVLDQLMTDYNSSCFRGTNYNQWNYCYAAIGSAKLKSIVTDRCFYDDPTESLAWLRMTFDSKDELGHHGYGTPCIETDSLGNGSSNASTYIGTFVQGQYINVGYGAYITRSLKLNNSVGKITIVYYDTDNAALRTDTINITSCDLIQTKHKYLQVPTGTKTIKAYKDQGANLIVKWFNIYKAGMRDVQVEPKVKFTNISTSNERITLSPVSASPSNPSDWIRLQKSNSNLANVNIQQDLNESVQWGNSTLNTNRTRCYMKTTSSGSVVNKVKVTNKFNVDPNRIYFCSIWVYIIQKEKGYIQFGVESFDDNNQIKLETLVLGSQVDEGILQNVNYNDIPQGRWVLLQGWIFPHKMEFDEIGSYMDKNQYFFGYTDSSELNNYSNGYGAKSVGTGDAPYTTGFRMHSNSIQLRFVLHDTNTTSKSEIMWALPVCCQQIAMGLGERSIYTPIFVEESQE